MLRSIMGLPQATNEPPPDLRTVESGQIVVNKRRAWAALMVATYMQIQTLFFDPLVRRGVEELGAGTHGRVHLTFFSIA